MVAQIGITGRLCSDCDCERRGGETSDTTKSVCVILHARALHTLEIEMGLTGAAQGVGSWLIQSVAQCTRKEGIATGSKGITLGTRSGSVGIDQPLWRTWAEAGKNGMQGYR